MKRCGSKLAPSNLNIFYTPFIWIKVWKKFESAGTVAYAAVLKMRGLTLRSAPTFLTLKGEHFLCAKLKSKDGTFHRLYNRQLFFSGELPSFISSLVMKLDFISQPSSKSTLPFAGFQHMQQCQVNFHSIFAPGF